MAPCERASNQGFTMLELALAVALSAVLLTAFFSASRALLQGLLMAADGIRGPAEAAEAISQIAEDVEEATAIPSFTPYSLVLTTSAGTVAYRLYSADSASRDIILERWATGGASMSIGPRRMIANFNPYGSSYILTGTVPTSAPVPLFIQRGGTPGNGPSLDIQLLLQPNQTAPITFVRTLAFIYGRRTW